MKSRIKFLYPLAFAFAASYAQAEDATWIWRAGVHSVQPKSNNHSVVNVDGATMVTFNGTYMATPNFGIEVLAALPFKHDINLNTGGRGGETKHLPPTVSAQYHFNPSGAIRPYVGAGINYTLFFNEKTSGALAGSKLELDSSLGLAVQAGADIAIGERWFVNLDARWFDIDTNAKLNNANLGAVEIDPYAVGLSLGRKF